ncbi:MAG: hypothetical protein ACD_23C00489G0010 [uncultured bacterium]|nr:MAG: hypothetical protein ACD_23C00489G0010 [uncultured bacterium]
MLVRESRSCGQRHPTADNGIRAKGTGLDPLQVHRAATPMTKALIQAKDLGQRALQQVLDIGRQRRLGIQTVWSQITKRLAQKLMVTTV